jgi:hypothetical protein
MAINTNPLSYNLYVTQIGVMAVVQTVETAGVVTGVDPAFNAIIPQMLNYAELRIQRDLDLLPSQTTSPVGTYVLTPGVNIFAIPINDFLTVQTIQVALVNGTTVVNSQPLVPVSREFIQNVYGSPVNAGMPRFFAMVGDTFGGNADTNNNVLLGPYPNAPYNLLVSGTIRVPSLYTYSQAPVADTAYTYISTYYPDLLIMASMVYISAFQRNFSATSDQGEMSLSYEKSYLALMTVAKQEENRKKFEGSGWSSYSTPVAATQTR